MAHVPDELIERGVVDVVQRNGQLDRAKPGGEMSAGAGLRCRADSDAAPSHSFGRSLSATDATPAESTNASVGYLAISKLIKGSIEIVCVYLSLII